MAPRQVELQDGLPEVVATHVAPRVEALREQPGLGDVAPDEGRKPQEDEEKVALKKL